MNLRAKTFSGLSWSFAAQALRQGSQFVIVVILAQLLSPHDFGVLAMAMVFTEFTVMFVDMGIGQALIQKQDAEDAHYCSAFWLNVALGLILMLVMAALSPLIARFYRQPGLGPVVAALSLNFVLASLTVVQQSLLTKEMEFRKLAFRDIGAVIVAGVVAIGLARAGWGVWSLVAQSLTFTAVNAAAVWGLSSWRPKFSFSFRHVKDIFHFSLHMTGSNAVNQLARQMDKLLIGRFLGSEALGLYALAYKLMLIPVENVTWVVNKVMFPAFSTIQHDLDRVRRTYTRMLKAVALVTFPLMVGLFVSAPEVVRVLFGPQWESTTVLIRLFCFCGMAQSLTALGGPIYLSQGRPDIQWKMTMVNAVLVVASIAGALKGGVTTVTLVYSLFHVLWLLVALAVMGRLIQLKVTAIYFRVIFVSMLNAVLLIVLWGIRQGLPRGNDIFHLVSMMVAGVVIYGGLLLITRQIKIENGKIIFPI